MNKYLKSLISGKPREKALHTLISGKLWVSFLGFGLILLNSCAPDLRLSTAATKLQAPQKAFLNESSRFWLEELMAGYGISAYTPDPKSEKLYYKGAKGTPWQEFATEPLISDTNRLSFLVQRKSSDSLFKVEYTASTQTLKVWNLINIKSKEGPWQAAFELKAPATFPLSIGKAQEDRLGFFYVLALHQPWGKKWTKAESKETSTPNFEYKVIWVKDLTYEKDADAIKNRMVNTALYLGKPMQLYHIEPRSVKRWFKKREGLSFLYRKQL